MRPTTDARTRLVARVQLGFEESLNRDFPTYIAGDFAPLEARIIDEDTYVEQGNDLDHALLPTRTVNYILGDLQPTPTSRSSASP